MSKSNESVGPGGKPGWRWFDERVAKDNDKRQPPLTPYAGWLYTILVAHVDNDRECFPGLTLLVKLGNMSRPMVIKAIRELVAAGLVTKIGESGNGKQMHYLLNPLPAPVNPVYRSTPFTAPVNGVDRHRSTPFTATGKRGLPEREPVEREPGNESQEHLAAGKPPQGKCARADRDELWDAIVLITSADTTLSRTRGAIGKVVKELVDADPPYTSDEVLILPFAVFDAGRNFRITVSSIPNHISLVRSQSFADRRRSMLVRLHSDQRDAMLESLRDFSEHMGGCK